MSLEIIKKLWFWCFKEYWIDGTLIELDSDEHQYVVYVVLTYFKANFHFYTLENI